MIHPCSQKGISGGLGVNQKLLFKVECSQLIARIQSLLVIRRSHIYHYKQTSTGLAGPIAILKLAL